MMDQNKIKIAAKPHLNNRLHAAFIFINLPHPFLLIFKYVSYEKQFSGKQKQPGQ